ncbi:MAG: ATP-dependent helicase HrpB [Cyclobacteriaceae bacterium]|jgi:ATP-dependent helicase HrpB
MEYPVLDILPQLLFHLASRPVVILQAPPGAGKSTVLPLHLLQQPWLGEQKILMLEPRRLAARSVAMRLAGQLSEEAGHTVGFRMRFETKVSAATRLEIITEGILTRLIQEDNALEGVGLVIFDEFHERSLQADLALALCLQLQQVLRPDLKILIMSATLDGEALSARLQGAPVITSQGRLFPVSVRYADREEESPVAQRVARAVRSALRDETGDILVFLPGTAEIHRTAELLADVTGAVVCPLYGDLPFRQQQDVLLPRADGLRKIVLATSIAETSLTIEGIRVVIDSGYSRVPRFDPRSGFTRLETVRVTQDAADQRAGRAGRLGPGIAYRLWPQHLKLVPNRSPEILEADLASLILELANWGVADVHDLFWLTPPPAGAVEQARQLLAGLQALEQNKITPLGRTMVQLPTHPRLAHLLVLASREDRVAFASDLVALLEERDPLPREAGADITLRLNALAQWRTGERVAAERSVLERLEKTAAIWRKHFRVTPARGQVSHYTAGRLLSWAFPERVAKQVSRMGEQYKLANGRVARLPKGDELATETWIAVAALDGGSGEGRIFLAAPLDERDLADQAEQQHTMRWNSEREAIEMVEELRVGQLPLQTRTRSLPGDDEQVAFLLSVIQERGLSWAGWADEQREWQARVISLRLWRPDEPWPDVRDEQLLASAAEWLAPFLQGISKRSELQKLNWHDVMMTVLPWSLASSLDRLAPRKMTVPSGSQIALHYHESGQAPFMEVRLQELFGLTETPTVNDGRQKIILHLLSPGYKPVQVTQDLKSFWQTTYHQVRNELRRRYPKHHWPEDPWTAEAVRGVKRKG